MPTRRNPKNAIRWFDRIKSHRLSLRQDHWLKQVEVEEGEVSAVFNNSFDVRLGNYQLNFNCKEQALHPLGILIDPPLMDSVSRGDRVRLKSDSLLLKGRKFVLSPEIEPVKIKCPACEDRLKNNLQKLENYIRVFGTETDFFNQTENFFDKLRSKLPDLSELLDHFGAGPGLTPAFDDFIAGSLLIDRILQENKIVLTDELIKNIEKRTTLTSWWQLKFAGRGVFNLGFEKYIRHLLTGKLEAGKSLRCLKFGHSSGTDICRGIYFYLNEIYL
ncbi:MAG: DUF2877 domain-containing protein [bacterium]